MKSADASINAQLTPQERTAFNATTNVVFGPTAATIVERAAALSADLIVMGTHGRGGVAHLLMGSVAERVVRTAGCPVLTTRGIAADVRTAAVARVEEAIPVGVT